MGDDVTIVHCFVIFLRFLSFFLPFSIYLTVRPEERNNPTKKSKPAKHLKNNFYHVSNWVILCKAYQN